MGSCVTSLSTGERLLREILNSVDPVLGHEI